MNVKETILAILDEAFDRPPTSWAHFTEGDGQSGYFGTLEKIDFRNAGQSIAGNSIAAQTKHVTFVIRVATKSSTANSIAPDADQWRQSWSIDDLDSEKWNRMRQELRNAYIELRQFIRETPITDDVTFANVIGAIVHVAYHLGAIRCKALAVNDT
jgi:hypothetical protein